MALRTDKQIIAIRMLRIISRSRQSGNEICSVNRIQCEKYFSSKIIQKMRQRGEFQIYFCF